MPSTELDDMVEVCHIINEVTGPEVRYRAVFEGSCRDPIQFLDEPLYQVWRDREHCVAKKLFRGTDSQTRAFLVGILEGISAARNRW